MAARRTVRDIRAERAVTQTRRATAFTTADAAMEAARAARQRGELAAALEAAEAAAALAPDRHDAWVLLAAVASRANRPERAMEAQLRGLQTTDDAVQQARLDADRAWILANLGRIAEAAALARRAAPALESEPVARGIVAATLATAGFSEEAVPHLQAVTAAFPTRPDLWFNLAVACRTLGRLDEAEAALERAIAVGPGFLLSYEMLAGLRSATAEKNHVDRLRSVRARMAPGRDAARIDYALFKQLDDLGRTAEAWPVLQRAAAGAARTADWSEARDRTFADATMAAFPTDRRATSTGSPRPIFIVGLPRTGTTLLERVFSAHSRVRALGELDAFGRALKAAAGQPHLPYVDAPAIRDIDGIDWDRVGRAYRTETGDLGQGAEVVVDKLPLNFWYAGAIAAALPDAVMVHLRREPMDTLFGAYKLSFGPAFDWSYRFEDLAGHYRQYRRLADHWRRTLGDRFVDLQYEALVRDAAGVVPTLLQQVGLPFEEACLSPHLAEGSVQTPSASQVRQPITDRNVGAWRRYAAELEPLRALLEADGFVDAQGDGVPWSA